MSKKRRTHILLLIALFMAATVIEYVVLGNSARVRREDIVQETTLYGQNLVNSIQLTLENTVESTESLKYFYLEYGEDCFDSFDSIAANISEDNPIISSMYIAPEGVIELAYPKDVNEATIGFAMLEDPEQGPRAQLAKDTGKITVAGPHDLIEGGIGFIIRNPVYKDGEFLGFTIIVLDWDLFVEEILNNIDFISTDYKFAVWKEDNDETAVTDADGFIMRNTSDSITSNVDIEFEVPNDTWHLIIEPVSGWQVYQSMRGEIVVSVVCTLAIIFFLYFLCLYVERNKDFALKEVENNTKTQYMEQLSDALEKAKQADMAKTMFLSQMSHDIRTPLNGIIGLLTIDEKHPDDIELLKQNREKAKVAANHLLSLISDVLTLSKLADTSITLTNEPFDLWSTLLDVETIVRIRANEAGIKFISNIDIHDFQNRYVYGSPLYFRQIFLNIFSNSIKYNKPNGQIVGTAQQIQYYQDTVVYQFVISDTGIGMSEEFLEHLFEPFVQEHSDARSTFKGTGLGMSIVKALVDKMDGTIDVESKLDEGTTIMVRIPFKVAREEDVKQKW